MDSMPAWAGKMLNLLDSNGVSYPADIIRTITPLGDHGAAEYFVNKLGLKLSKDEIFTQLDAYALPRYRDSILPKAGVLALLQALQSQGIRTCILTASPQRMIQPCLARNGLTNYFDFIWSCDDVGLTKSQPEIYLKTCAQLGCKPQQTAFFDDNLLALTTAREAGLATVGVYDESSAGDEQAIRAVCSRYIHSFEELL